MFLSIKKYITTLTLLAVLISNFILAQNDNQGYVYNVKLDLDHRYEPKALISVGLNFTLTPNLFLIVIIKQ